MAARAFKPNCLRARMHMRTINIAAVGEITAPAAPPRNVKNKRILAKIYLDVKQY